MIFSDIITYDDDSGSNISLLKRHYSFRITSHEQAAILWAQIFHARKTLDYVMYFSARVHRKRTVLERDGAYVELFITCLGQ